MDIPCMGDLALFFVPAKQQADCFCLRIDAGKNHFRMERSANNRITNDKHLGT
jgi:hypothetical protein